MNGAGRLARSVAADRIVVGLAAATLCAFLLSLVTGPAGPGFGGGVAAWLILTEIRLPRAILGLLVGAILGLAGAALQGFLRNPLAEPGILGMSSGAALGAVLAIHSGLASAAAIALPLGGLLGAGIATLALLVLAGDDGGPVTLILAGIAVSGLATALTALALNLSSNPFAAVEIVFWLMGSLADRSLAHVWVAAPLILAAILILLRLGRDLETLTLGEDAARTLGIDLNRTRRMVVAGTALGIGAATAVTGVIGFVGLVVPHILRPHVGHSPARLLPASMLAGALLILLADTGLRLAAPWVELRIGVLSALLGAPFFLWLVVRLRRDLAP